MSVQKLAVGIQVSGNPPLGIARAILLFARLNRLESVTVADHFQGFIPMALWDRKFSWAASVLANPHESFDYQVVLGYLAARAGKIRLGVGVTEANRRHPVLIAQSMLTLAHAVRRRPILGIGAGERENIEPYGLDFSTPVGRLEEALQIIRLCFSRNDTIDFRGKYFRLDNATMALQSPKGRLPEIWIAGHGARMLRLTGEYSDGWFPTLVASPSEYASKLAIIRSAARDAGRNPAAILPALHQYIVVAPTEAEARAMLDTKAGHFAALMNASAELWRQLGKEHPFGADFRGYVDFLPERYDLRTVEAALAALPPELLGYGLVWGTPEQIADKLRAFGDAGLRHVVLDLASALVSRRATLYGLFAIRKIAGLLKRGSPARSGVPGFQQ
ncbi:MAG TPA: LLM class flavin-dependent oxidoreductase [Chloroflexota bacterium]|nr:LLM class flavin-dependent oxidoreductase [Chloroflexota bacterium]